MDGLGVRCVSTGDWVTAAETAECVLALDALGVGRRGPHAVRRGRRACGWPTAPTGPGWSIPDRVTFPAAERTTYTAGAIVLAADALSGTTPAAGLFRGEGLPATLDLAESECPLGAPGGCTAA